MIKEIIENILGLAFEISNNTDFDVFVDYMPHVKGLHVRVFNKDGEDIYNERRYYGKSFEDDYRGDFDSIKLYLINLLTKNKGGIKYE